MKIIGVVGKSGSGKNTFTKEMLDYHKTLLIDTIDLDEVAHDVLNNNEKAKEELVEAFGESIIYTSFARKPRSL